jgi:hypothetical protein
MEKDKLTEVSSQLNRRRHATLAFLNDKVKLDFICETKAKLYMGLNLVKR